MSTFVACLVSFAAFAFAQSATATLSGIVVDESDAVVPDVVVTVLAKGTGFQREGGTNKDGQFTFPALQPGRYIVRATRKGFTPVEVPDVTLNVNDNVSIKLQLKVEGLGEAVTVTAEPARINAGASVGTVIDRQFVENLPMSGRSFQTLLSLTPGFVTVKSSSTEPGQFSVNGQRSDANYFMVDGVSANAGVAMDITRGQAFAGSVASFNAIGGTSGLVSVDALEEFRVETSTFAPEFGRTPGAQVSIVTRSGTNSYRGSLFEYFRNEALDANDWFANRNGFKKQPLRQNDFGGVMGGPLRRDRFFYFFSYEGLRLRVPQVRASHVPTLALRQAAAAAMRPFLNAYPLPNGRDLGNGLAEFVAGYSDPSSADATSLRVDHHRGDLQLFARYNDAPSSNRLRSGGSFSLNTVLESALKNRTLTAGGTWMLGRSLLNETRINYSRARMDSTITLDDFGGATPLSVSNYAPPGTSDDDSLLVFILLGGTSSQFSNGKNVTNRQQQVNVVHSTTLPAGRHLLKAGVDHRALFPSSGPRSYEQTPLFASAQTAGAAQPIRVQITARDHVRLHFQNLSAFAQDTWTATTRLTVTSGVRWDYNAPPSTRGGDELATVSGLDHVATATIAPRGTPLYEANRTNFAPRVGVAWQLNESGRSTLRGGVGLFYDLGYGDAAGRAATSVTHSRVRNVTGLPYPLQPEQAFTLATAAPPYTAIVYDPALETPYTAQWNIAFERDLGARQTLTATYVGAAGRRLLRQETYSAPNPTFSTLLVTRGDAESSYRSVQLQYQRRLSNRLQALASYTWAKAEDTVSSSSANALTAPGSRIDPDSNRGPADFDLRHTFSAAATYLLPERREGSVVGAIARGWAMHGLVRAQSAPPVNIIATRDIGFARVDLRPDRVAGQPLTIEDPSAPGGWRINPAAFVTATAPQHGTLGRNALRGFGLFQIDLAIHRDFRIHGTTRLQLRAEAFNVTNRPNFGPPVGVTTDPMFGLSTTMLNRALGAGGISGGFNPLYQIGGPRSVQLALRLQF